MYTSTNPQLEGRATMDAQIVSEIENSVDGSPFVEIFANGCVEGTCWKTTLQTKLFSAEQNIDPITIAPTRYC